HLRAAMGRATDYSDESHFGLQSVRLSYRCPLRYLDRLTVLAGNLINESDDAAPKLGFVDSHESLCQQKPFGGGEEIRHVGRRGCFLEPAECGRFAATGSLRCG